MDTSYGTPIEYSTPIQSAPIEYNSTPIDYSTPIEFGNPINNGTSPAPVPDPTPDVDASEFEAVLNVAVPEDAVVFINDKQTKTPGKSRTYVSRNLKQGFKYAYEVKVEVVRAGEKQTQTKLVDLRAGLTKELAFEFASAEPVVTSVKLTVPADAKVILGGVETTAVGTTRIFSTTKLPDGKTWKDYEIKVLVEHEGKQLMQNKVLEIKAGDEVDLDFVFDGTELASR
jgi:uncharacterized protein (TIGR03000 family)